jgi:hypothetical protein
MPSYEYQCVDCQTKDILIGGLDDHTALCIHCGSLMLRLDDDIFSPYFKDYKEPWSCKSCENPKCLPFGRQMPHLYPSHLEGL